MITVSSTLQIGGSTDAGWRDYIAGVRDLLTGVGLALVPATGAVDPATAIRPTTSGGNGGFLVFALADGGPDAFLKVEFITYNSSGLYFSLALTAGTGHNGAGTLTGLVGARVNVGFVGTSGGLASFVPSMATGDAGCVVLQIGTTSGIIGGFFLFERLRDANGAPTAEGVWLVAQSATTSTIPVYRTQVVAYGEANVPPLEARISNGLSGANVPSANGRVGLAVVRPIHGWELQHSALLTLFQVNAFPVSGTEQDLTLYGTTARFLTLAQGPSLADGITATSRIALRYVP